MLKVTDVDHKVFFEIGSSNVFGTLLRYCLVDPSKSDNIK